MKTHSFLLRATVATTLAAVLAGCAVGPSYERPDAPSTAAWKEAPAAEGWTPAAPAEALERGPWWKLFADPTLDALAEQVQVSNQNIALAVASYTQAQAAVREQRSALFPSVGLTGGVRRSGNRSTNSSTGSGNIELGAAWEVDLWGRLRQSVSSAQALAQASEADLAAARLSMLGELAINYFSLREADAELAVLDTTI